jgi:hypothetical protein
MDIDKNITLSKSEEKPYFILSSKLSKDDAIELEKEVTEFILSRENKVFERLIHLNEMGKETNENNILKTDKLTDHQFGKNCFYKGSSEAFKTNIDVLKNRISENKKINLE